MFRELAAGEASTGVHTIQALAGDGTVLARYECPCGLCEAWRAARPMLDAALADLERPERPDWLGG